MTRASSTTIASASSVRAFVSVLVRNTMKPSTAPPTMTIAATVVIKLLELWEAHSCAWCSARASSLSFRW